MKKPPLPDLMEKQKVVHCALCPCLRVSDADNPCTLGYTVGTCVHKKQFERVSINCRLERIVCRGDEDYRPNSIFVGEIHW